MASYDCEYSIEAPLSRTLQRTFAFFGWIRLETNGSKVTKVNGYKAQQSKDTATDETTAIDLPSSNVLQFFTADGSIVSARPSGTEPKIKFYCSVNTTLESKAAFYETEAALDAKLDALLTDLGAK